MESKLMSEDQAVMNLFDSVHHDDDYSLSLKIVSQSMLVDPVLDYREVREGSNDGNGTVEDGPSFVFGSPKLGRAGSSSGVVGNEDSKVDVELIESFIARVLVGEEPSSLNPKVPSGS